MTSELEKQLIEEFRRAARHAPRSGPEFLASIRAPRPRWRTGAALAAAAAVIVLSAGGALGVSALDRTSTDRTSAGRTSADHAGADRADGPAAAQEEAAPAAYPDIAKVWPGAVHTLPKTLPNGSPYQPDLFLDRNTLLVRTHKDGNADRMDGLWAYDVTKHTARRLVAVTWPKGATATASFIAHGDGQLAWWTAHKRDGKVIVDIWAAPASGGAQRKVTSFEGRPGWGGIDMVIGGGHVVWTPWGGTGVYRAPLSGGKPQRVPGASRFSLLAWPWAADAKGNLLDLRNGSTRKAGAPEGHQCSVTWCVKGGTATRRDASLTRNLPGPAVKHAPALDRFVVVPDPERYRQVLYDLTTGKAGDLGLEPDKNRVMPAVVLDHRAPGVLRYERNGRMVVVDLDAIK